MRIRIEKAVFDVFLQRRISALRNRFYNWLMTFLSLIAGKSELVVERNNASELAPSAAIRLLGDPMVMQAIRADLLAGVIAMGYSAVDAAKAVTLPVLTMMAGKDDLLRSACVRQLHENLAGEKDWLAVAEYARRQARATSA